MKTFLVFIIVSAWLWWYLISSKQIDPEQAKFVLSHVREYLDAAFNSVTNAQKTADELNARNAKVQQQLEDAKK